jgi:small subunit ribosomal protein S2
MKPFIFTERNGIHIIDLQQTLSSLDNSFNMIRDTVANGNTVLFVGTKRQAQETIAKEAIRANMPHVTYRWLGGTLTNWRTIKQRIDTLHTLERRRENGEFELLTKKEALDYDRLITKLNLRLGGIKELKKLPDLLFVIDVHREFTAIKEANALKIPVIAMVDTNCDPDQIDLVIPANDDAIRAIKLIVARMADAALEGAAMRKEVPQTESVEGTAETDDKYLGEATLAKLRAGLEFEDTETTGADEETPAEA